MTEAKGDAKTPPATAPAIDDFDMESATEASSLSKAGLLIAGAVIVLLFLVSFLSGPNDAPPLAEASAEVSADAAADIAADAAMAAGADAAAAGAQAAAEEEAAPAIDANTTVVSTEFPALASACNAYSDKAAGNKCSELGVKFEMGTGVTKDIPRAIEFYEVGCAKGSAMACANAGTRYGDKEGSWRWPERSFLLLQRACEEEEPHGCSELGYNYEYGVGVTPDPVRARQLYVWACDRGYKNACVYRDKLDAK